MWFGRKNKKPLLSVNIREISITAKISTEIILTLFHFPYIFSKIKALTKQNVIFIIIAVNRYKTYMSTKNQYIKYPKTLALGYTTICFLL